MVNRFTALLCLGVAGTLAGLESQSAFVGGAVTAFGLGLLMGVRACTEELGTRLTK